MVQKHYEGRKRPNKLGDVDKYASYLYCADCGAKLYLHRGKNIKPENNYYQCGGYQSKGGSYCTVHRIKTDVLDKLVLDQIRYMTDLARENPQEFYEMAVENGREKSQKMKKEYEQKRSKAENRIKELDSIMSCLYADKALGRITPERYDSLSAGYEKEQSELENELTELEKQFDIMSMQEKYIHDFIEKAKANIEMKELTPELLRAFISRIEVYEKPEKYSRTCGNTILIRYTFQSLHQPAPILTPNTNRIFAQAAC